MRVTKAPELATAQDIILTDPSAEAAADAVTMTLGTLAYDYAGPNTDVVVVPDAKPKRKSRFFFRPRMTTVEYIRKNKAKYAPKKLDNVNQAIVDRTATYRKELPKTLKRDIETVRDFFLSTIAPKIYSADAGVIQAQAVAQNIVGDIDTRMFDMHNRMLQVGVNLMMARFVASHLGLPVDAANAILEEFYPKATSNKVTVPIPQIPDGAEPYQSERRTRQRRGQVEPKRVKPQKEKRKREVPLSDEENDY